jgi:hypothetical protein
MHGAGPANAEPAPAIGEASSRAYSRVATASVASPATNATLCAV